MPVRVYCFVGTGHVKRDFATMELADRYLNQFTNLLIVTPDEVTTYPGYRLFGEIWRRHEGADVGPQLSILQGEPALDWSI